MRRIPDSANVYLKGSPGIKPLPAQIEVEEELGCEDQSTFRAVSARANYVSSDRVDVQYASKECCRYMSKPGSLAQAALKRLGRYILNHKRLVYKFPGQSARYTPIRTGRVAHAPARVRVEVR